MVFGKVLLVKDNDLPVVYVLMATYNGSQYIEQQLDSILNQTYPNIRLIVSDDTSMDNTFEILEKYSKKYSNITLLRNKIRLGFVKNFELLINAVDGDYYALSDQDDIWKHDKIALSIEKIMIKEKTFPNKAIMLHSDLEIIDSNNEILYPSYFKYRGYHFKKTKDIATVAE